MARSTFAFQELGAIRLTDFNRDVQWDRIADKSASNSAWDIAIIGGGATGVGIAIDAATRGYSVCLVEQSDFGKGTSSRSTKLVHGGVRYLRQGNTSLVKEALYERALLLRNAPHAAHPLPFIIPCRNKLEWLFYGIGMKVYDLLAGSENLSPSQWLRRKTIFERVATLDSRKCSAGVLYYDGQFDDARLLINMAQTAVNHGACLVNYVQAQSIYKDDSGRITGLTAVDLEGNRSASISARVVINAGGPFCDAIRHMADPTLQNLVAASQGVHIVLPQQFLPGQTAIIVPKTPDGRVVFMIPWHDHVVVGTTDTPIEKANIEPQALEAEIEFLLELASRYLVRQPTRSDVLSVFTGIRPLVKAGAGKSTSALSRDHTIERTAPGLLTITGGKWTTYRRMAEDCVNQAADVAELPKRPCETKSLRIHGAHESVTHQTPPTSSNSSEDPLRVYGVDGPRIRSLTEQSPGFAEQIDGRLNITLGQVHWAVKHEMARTLDDVLARRTRALFMNVAASLAAAPRVVGLMAKELDKDVAWQREELDRFAAIAKHYAP